MVEFIELKQKKNYLHSEFFNKHDLVQDEDIPWKDYESSGSIPENDIYIYIYIATKSKP